MVEKKKRMPITLNAAEKQGFLSVVSERDKLMAEAQRLDQYIQQLAQEVVQHHNEDVSVGWQLDLSAGQIVPVKQRTTNKI